MEPMLSSPDGLMSSAMSLYREALRFLEEGVRENSLIKVKDAATRAWEAVTQAIDALILKRTSQLPKSHMRGGGSS